MDKEFAEKLIKDAKSILEKLDRDSVRFKYESINWEDLHVVDVAEVDSFYNGNYIQVIIEEAAPDAISLQAEIMRQLMDMGYKNIDVITQW